MNAINQNSNKAPNHWGIVPFLNAVSVLSDGGKRIKKKSYLEVGTLPIIDQGQKYSSGFMMNLGEPYDHAAKQQSYIAWGFNPRIENLPIMCSIVCFGGAQ
jgi:hypothetical protein